MADATMESKINELEARYRAAAAEGKHDFQTTSRNSPQFPRRPRLFDDFLVVRTRSPITAESVPVPPLSAPTTMHDTSLINDFRFKSNSSLARSDIIPSLPPLIDDASANAFTSMTASWTGPPSRTPVTQMQTSQLVTPGSLSASVPFLNMQPNIVSPQTRIGILKTPSSASPVPNTPSMTASSFPLSIDCSKFETTTPGHLHRSSGSSSSSNSNLFCPISKPTSINGTSSDYVAPSRPHLELGIAPSSSPVRASRAGLDFSALRTCSPVVTTRTRVDSGDMSVPSPSPSSGVSRIGSDYRTPSSGSPISGSFCRSGQDFRIMSSSSPSPGSASRAGPGFRMSSSSSPSPSLVTGLDFRPSGSPSPITKSGFDFSSTSITQSPGTNGATAIRSGLDFKTPTPSPSHTNSGEWFSGRRRSNVASTPSPLEFGNSRPGITSSPGGSGMSLALNGQPRRRHALNLACSPQTPKALDSAEIDLKYLEIIKQSGILTIDGHRIPADISELDPLGDLGHGTCGHVVKMIHRTTSHVMAVKQMQRSGSCEDNKRIIMDLDVVIKSHSCPYIVKCIGTFITSSDVWICMELMATCLEKLPKKLGAPIPEFILGKVTVATVNALHYLKENHGVIHRDVKPSNILLDERGRIKLCDFGISGRLVDSKAKTRSAGCTAYMSPERIDPPDPLKPDYDIRADVWSLGLSLVELATGEFPYKNCSTDFEVLTKVLQDDPPSLPAGKGFSMDFSALVRACLTKDYRRRPKYQQLLEHNFVRRYTSLNVDVAAWYARITKSFDAPQAES